MRCYKIACSVSGGVTGSRSSDLKNGKGKVFVTSSKKKAEKKASDYNKEMNTIYSTAYFQAKVVEIN
jgi:hypothetical protein